MATIPLFQLPIVAMENTFSIMTPLELIDLSLVSARSKTTVKNFLRVRPKFKAEMNISRGSNIIISAREEWRLKKINKLEEERRFMNNEVNEMAKAFEYIKEVFECVFHSIRIDFSRLHDENRQFIDWLRSQQQIFDTIAVQGSYQNYDDDVKYLMENLKATGELVLVMLRHADDFQLEIPEGLRILHVDSSGFIKYEQFMKLDCEQIVFLRSPLTSQEIYRFLKSWMACESHLNLKALQITIDHPDVIDAVKEIPHVEVTIDNNIRRMFDSYAFFNSLTNGFNITRSDGKIATTCVLQTASTSRLYLVLH